LFTDAGAVAAGYKLYTYAAGTTTAQATYSDSALAVANANPIVLDSAGRAKIFLPGQSFKFVLKTAADVTVWTIDNVAATPEFDVDLDITGTAGEALTAGECVALSDGTGGLTAGRWYLADADTVAISSGAERIGFVPADIASGASGSIRVGGRITGLAGLAAGSTYYISATAGAVTTTAPTNARKVGVADSATSIAVGDDMAYPVATLTLPGIVSIGAQSLAGQKDFQTAPRFAAGGSVDVDQLRPVGHLTTDYTQRGNVDAAETDMTSLTLAADSLSRNGMILRVTSWGTTAANANNKTYKVYLGTSSVSAVTAANATQWSAVTEIVRDAAGSQLVILMLGLHQMASVYDQDLTFAEDETTALAVKTTGQGTATNDLIQYMTHVQILGA